MGYADSPLSGTIVETYDVFYGISMNKTLTNQVIALSGLAQTVALIQQIARKGAADQDSVRVLIASALKVDADDVLDVYGGISGLREGLKQLVRQLSSPRQVDPEMARYASSLIYLQQQLMQDKAMVEAVGVAVTRAQQVAETTGDILDEAVLTELADGYQRTLSTMKPRILVSGDQRYLSDPFNAKRIRALLLAGVRSCVLWQQCGGVRWKLLWVRGRILKEARRLLEQLDPDR